MTRLPIPMAAAALLACVSIAAVAADVPLRFPDGFDKGVHYGTVNRGNINEELYTSPEAIAAAKKGEPLPEGTVITLVDTRDGKLFRYVVMEKRVGWGAEFPASQRTGDWRFQWFNPDRTVKADEDMGRCMSCHHSRGSQDFVWSHDLMRSAH